jgi:putative ABC transport system substrate-binding protein
VAAFRKGLSEIGYVEGQNVAVEYHWFSGQYDRLPMLMADLVRRGVAVIATPGGTLAASAAKTATTTIPIVFGVGEDPVTGGLVSSLARPGGNATGVNIFIWEVAAKRLGLLHELAPKAVRVAVLINPGNVPSAEATLRDLPEAARAIGLQIQVLNASTSGEIEAAFATLVRDRADALFVAADTFLISRRVQFATLATRHGIPAAYSTPRGGRSWRVDELRRQHSGHVASGRRLYQSNPEGRQAGGPAGRTAEFVINLVTTKALGLDVPDSLLARADEVIE